MSAAILVVEDEPRMQEVLGSALRFEGYDVATASTGEEAVSRLEARDFDLIIADISLPGVSGLEVLEKARLLNPAAPVILISGYATIETAIEALHKGACDLIRKPLNLDELCATITRLLEARRAVDEARERDRLVEEYRAELHRAGDGLIGASGAMEAVRREIARFAPAPTNVLIIGERGVGKELVARAIHAASPVHAGPFVTITCGAVPEASFEHQLVEDARNGTVFLHEIAELPVSLQATLLHLIDEGRVGKGSTRLVASTTRDLRVESEARRFREDLYFRLNVVHIAVPPLRERLADIPLLVDHFVHRLNLKLGTRFAGVDRDVLRVLGAHAWKGNVRELENVLEHAMLRGEDAVLHVQDFDAAVTTEPFDAPSGLRKAVRDFERRRILDVLARNGDDKRAAARALGISLASLYRKLGVSSGEA